MSRHSLVPLALLPLLGCGPPFGPDEVEAGTIGAEVQIRGGFSPASTSLGRHENVRWQNFSTLQHHIVSDIIVKERPGPTGSFDTLYLFNSGPISAATIGTAGDTVAGEFYILAFPTEGVYPYHCRIHPGMTGTIRVRPPS